MNANNGLLNNMVDARKWIFDVIKGIQGMWLNINTFEPFLCSYELGKKLQQNLYFFPVEVVPESILCCYNKTSSLCNL
jgi:hypothetical protein